MSAPKTIALSFDGGLVRSYRPGDAASLARHADDREVWLNLRDAFPHPYRIEHAVAFLAAALAADPQTHLAIDVGGEAVGGIGLGLHEDVERLSAEVGYWLGRPFWGQGIATAALRALTAFGVGELGLVRLHAVPYEWNLASQRVLEKAGYVLEGRLRRSAIKDGRIVDQLLYAYVVPG
jgi:ribosomal-protein-alanine N-acetyltransferase